MLLAAAGKFGQFVGQVTVDYDLMTNEIRKKKAILYDANELPAVQHELQKVTELERIGKDKMKTIEFYQKETL